MRDGDPVEHISFHLRLAPIQSDERARVIRGSYLVHGDSEAAVSEKESWCTERKKKNTHTHIQAPPVHRM